MFNFLDLLVRWLEKIKDIPPKQWFFMVNLYHAKKIRQKSPPKKQIQDFEGGNRTKQTTGGVASVLEEVASNEEIATRCQGLCGR